jgi:hypothetical protein
MLLERRYRTVARTKEGLSEQAILMARSGKSARLYTTLQVARRLAVRSMTLMRWVVNEDINCPAVHTASSRTLNWLWNEREIQAAAEFKKWAFIKRTHRRTGRKRI